MAVTCEAVGMAGGEAGRDGGAGARTVAAGRRPSTAQNAHASCRVPRPRWRLARRRPSQLAKDALVWPHRHLNGRLPAEARPRGAPQWAPSIARRSPRRRGCCCCCCAERARRGQGGRAAAAAAAAVGDSASASVSGESQGGGLARASGWSLPRGGRSRRRAGAGEGASQSGPWTERYGRTSPTKAVARSVGRRAQSPSTGAATA